jgi:hypothetical protein
MRRVGEAAMHECIRCQQIAEFVMNRWRRYRKHRQKQYPRHYNGRGGGNRTCEFPIPRTPDHSKRSSSILLSVYRSALLEPGAA